MLVFGHPFMGGIDGLFASPSIFRNQIIMAIPFYKMSGSGNDFIIIDNREKLLAGDLNRHGMLLCRDRFSIGANGLILVDSSSVADFSWRLFNADGSEAEMCGNGARCVAMFAYKTGLAGDKMTFETGAGLLKGFVQQGGNVRIELTRPFDLQMDNLITVNGVETRVDKLNTGVPHAVCFVGGDIAGDDAVGSDADSDIDSHDINDIGRQVRYHDRFAPDGVNVNLVEVKDGHSLKIRTYERGVEAETMACGTGAVASSLIAARRGMVTSPVTVWPTGGKPLTVHFGQVGAGECGDSNDWGAVYLEGDALTVCTGQIMDDAFR